MGRIVHDAIVVTSFHKPYIQKAHEAAKTLGLPVTELIEGQVNEYYTFLIGPDGSKEGWAESDKGEKQRNLWKAWAIKNREEISVDWVHVRYGSIHEVKTTVVSHQDY